MKTLAIPFIKRDYCLDLFLAQIEAQTYPKKDLRLVFVDNSNDTDYGEILKKRLALVADNYASTKYIKMNHTSYDHNDYGIDVRLKKHRAVVQTKRRIYSETEDDLFIVEDDTLIKPNALKKLDEICNVCEDAVAACGYSFYWHEGWKGRPNVWDFKMEGVEGTDTDTPQLKWQMVPTQGIRTGVESIGACGTGCVLLKREFLDSGYVPQEIVDSLGFKGQDIHVGYWINVKMKKRLYVDWRLRCPHILKNKLGVIEVIGAKIIIENGRYVATW